MTANTVLDIIKRSLRLLGVASQGETPTANEANEALMALNSMVESWGNERLMLYTVANNLFTITAGTSSYTIGAAGSGATWESACISRPELVQKSGSFIRQNATDYPVEFYDNDRFQEIAAKSESGFPCKYTIDWDYPIATVRLFPVPAESGLQFGLSELKQLSKFNYLTDALVLPNGYQEALTFNLAVMLSPEYGVEPSAAVVAQAQSSKFAIKRLNSPMVLLDGDSALLRNTNYSIYTDSYLS